MRLPNSSTPPPRHPLAHGFRHDLVAVPHGPAAVGEAVPGVLVRSAGGLHDAVERQAADDHDPGHARSFRAGLSRPLHERAARGSTSRGRRYWSWCPSRERTGKDTTFSSSPGPPGAGGRRRRARERCRGGGRRRHRSSGIAIVNRAGRGVQRVRFATVGEYRRYGASCCAVRPIRAVVRREGVRRAGGCADGACSPGRAAGRGRPRPGRRSPGPSGSWSKPGSSWSPSGWWPPGRWCIRIARVVG